MSGEERLELLLLIGIFVVYAAAFSVFNSQVIQGVRYMPLFDDAMISMRYAKNLSLGQGLRFNVGQAPVEGFSNPAWTFLMAAVIKTVGSGPLSLAWVRTLDLGTHLLALLLAWGFCREVFPERPRVRFLAVLLYGISLPGLYWALMGMECSLQAALLTAAAWAAWRAVQSGRASWTLPLLCFLGPLLRLEMAMFLAILVAAVAWQAPLPGRALALRCALWMLLGLGLQTGLRWWYYGEVLPNTYYLKMTGIPLWIRLARGALTFGDLLGRGWALILLLSVLGCFYGARERAWILATPLLAAVAAHVWVGGDSWEGQAFSRFLVQGLFFAYLSCALGIAILAGWLLKRGWKPAAFLLGLVLALATVFVAERDQDGSLAVVRLRRRALYVDSSLSLAQIGLLYGRIAAPDATWAVIAVGNIGYFCENRILDLFGKCDRVLARGEARPLMGDQGIRGYIPGHSKLDYAWSLGHERPDLVSAGLVHQEEAQRYLDRDYRLVTVKGAGISLYCRKDRLGALRLPQAAGSR